MSWKNITELREVERDYSGLVYSYRYAKKHKDLKNQYCSSYGGKKERQVGIAEPIAIKRGKNGEILYELRNRNVHFESEQVFETHLGKFASIDRGEFGGEMTLPNGVVIGGNFRYVFDQGEFVYGIDTSAHMLVAHTKIYRFNSNLEYECLYSVGDWYQSLVNNVSEDLYCRAVDISEDTANILLGGEVFTIDEQGNRSDWGEIRVLNISDGDIHEVIRMAGKPLGSAEYVIVEGNEIYISMDKMVMIINAVTKEIKYFTCISEEDEEELLRMEA
jgi:hypothetical protein